MEREKTQTNIWHVVVISGKGKGRESDGEVANWDKWSRKIFLTRWQLNRAKRGARAKRTPVGRDTKATWVAGPEAGAHLVCWNNSKCVCSAGGAGETGGTWGSTLIE